MVYILMGAGFEETELITPLDLLRRADVKVMTVGIGGKRITGGHGITVEADITIDTALLPRPTGLWAKIGSCVKSDAFLRKSLSATCSLCAIWTICSKRRKQVF